MNGTKKTVVFIGLGNPGPQYEATRHNVGAWLTSELAHSNSCSFEKYPKLKSFVAQYEYQSIKVFYLLPLTYMNLSGEAVRAFLSFFKIPVTDKVWVLHDELDFEPGIIKLKFAGGHGGHNGLRSIFEQLGTQQFSRIRIGIGHPLDKDKVSSYVLSSPRREEHDLIKKTATKIIMNQNLFLDKETTDLINYFNNPLL